MLNHNVKTKLCNVDNFILKDVKSYSSTLLLLDPTVMPSIVVVMTKYLTVILLIYNMDIYVHYTHHKNIYAAGTDYYCLYYHTEGWGEALYIFIPPFSFLS